MTDLRDLLSRATPGPWLVEHEPHESAIWTRQPHTGHLASTWDEDINGEFPMRENAALIVAAVNALPDLLSELDGARERIAELEAVLTGILPSKLCGESWGLPDDETVSIVVTFGALARARALGEKKS